jgi:HNH endonuclease
MQAWTLAAELPQVPLAEGGPDTDANMRPICAACNRRKVAAEAARGKKRLHKGAVADTDGLANRGTSGKSRGVR